MKAYDITGKPVDLPYNFEIYGREGDRIALMCTGCGTITNIRDQHGSFLAESGAQFVRVSCKKCGGGVIGFYEQKPKAVR